jgi:lysophospholipase L1-like esterase
VLQSPSVINEGISGEKASDGGPNEGVRRLENVLASRRPDILLLMEGTNDLLDCQVGVERGIAALTTMVRTAKGRGVRVALATIPPQPSTPSRLPCVAPLIPVFNDRIRGLADAEQVALADVYNAMKDDLSLIGPDDLHPTARGYEVMADVFFKTIMANFEQPAPALRGQ